MAMNAIEMDLDFYLLTAKLFKTRHAIFISKGFAMIFFDKNFGMFNGFRYFCIGLRANYTNLDLVWAVQFLCDGIAKKNCGKEGN
jgi:hypothetical protein